MPGKQKVNWTSKFAELIEEFIWIEAGGQQSGQDRNILFRDAVNALHQYQKESMEVPLKRAISFAVANAPANGDQWKIVLETIAARASDWECYSSEGGSVTEDIAAWLNYEANR